MPLISQESAQKATDKSELAWSRKSLTTSRAERIPDTKPLRGRSAVMAQAAQTGAESARWRR
jgi:hypothetical protein